MAMCLIFMKFGTQNKSNMLIMNIFKIDFHDPKLQIWHLEQIEHTNYEYST